MPRYGNGCILSWLSPVPLTSCIVLNVSTVLQALLHCCFIIHFVCYFCLLCHVMFYILPLLRFFPFLHKSYINPKKHLHITSRFYIYEQLADSLTKPLERVMYSKFTKLKGLLNLWFILLGSRQSIDLRTNPYDLLGDMLYRFLLDQYLLESSKNTSTHWLHPLHC